jgi:uncharacterized membrane protein YraQ (UPF0718 family)
MLIIGSAILFLFGMLLLSIQAIRIAFSLLKIAYYLAKLIACLVVLVICAVCIGVQKLAQAVDDWQWRRRCGEVLPPE